MSSGTPQGLPLRASRGATLKPAVLLAATLTLLAALFVSLAPPTSHADPSLDSFEQDFLVLINQYRADNGKPALVVDNRLNAAADWFANDMATDNYFAFNHHDNENPPRSPSERAAAFGFNAPVGENLAAGFTSAQSVFDAWKKSAGHNSNMLGNYATIGIGRATNSGSTYGVYWVTDFSPYNPPPTATFTPAPTQPPTAQPTATPVPTATQPLTPPITASPTKTPTPKPATATPHNTGSAILAWGDNDCDGIIGPIDSIRILRLDAGLSITTPDGCPTMGENFSAKGATHPWGDADCSGDANPLDSLLILRFDAGYEVDLPFGCPDLGTPL